jgi:hypothetical protein
MLESVSPDSAKGAEPDTGCSKLRHRVAKGIRSPDVRPIGGCRVGNTTDREGAEADSVAGPEFDEGGAGAICHPEVRPTLRRGRPGFLGVLEHLPGQRVRADLEVRERPQDQQHPGRL